MRALVTFLAWWWRGQPVHDVRAHGVLDAGAEERALVADVVLEDQNPPDPRLHPHRLLCVVVVGEEGGVAALHALVEVELDCNEAGLAAVRPHVLAVVVGFEKVA